MKKHIPLSVNLSYEAKLTVKIVVTVIIGNVAPLLIAILLEYTPLTELVFMYLDMLILPIPLLITAVWDKPRKPWIIACAAYLVFLVIFLGAQFYKKAYEESLIINVTPAVNTEEYLPFDPDSKIVKIDSQTLDFSQLPMDQLPVLDGAAAVFPVYSAFVHAVYPENTQLLTYGPFRYNNTVDGYQQLAQKKTDIFFGAYPSKAQIEYAQDQGTTFEYTQIGSEAFVFFVNKDNPIDSLTSQQIRDIYSGKITNWKEVGGLDEEIVPFQRNPGSGSQSMLIRFMGDTPILEPDTQRTEIGFMGEIIEEVADYENRTTSIGFSFRFYVEGMIRNPDIKLIAVDGVAPTKENIKNGAYPIVTPLYAVTWQGNDNENVQKLLAWILSEEGQYIIEQTGYVGIH